MKAVMVGLVLCAILVAAVFVYGCGPRAGVVQDKILAQIDSFLGELNVKRKTIEDQYRTLIADLGNVREQRIKTQVRYEQLEQKKAGTEARVKEIMGKLAALKELVKQANEAGELERNGRTWTAAELDKAANELIDEYNSAKTELESNLKVSIDTMKRALDFLVKQESAGDAMKKDIEVKLKTIDERKAAAESVRSARSMVGGETSITEKYAALNKNLDDLFVDVESALRGEEQALNDLPNTTKMADDLLAQPTDLGNTLGKLDAILGGSGGDKK